MLVLVESLRRFPRVSERLFFSRVVYCTLPPPPSTRSWAKDGRPRSINYSPDYCNFCLERRCARSGTAFAAPTIGYQPVRVSGHLVLIHPYRYHSFATSKLILHLCPSFWSCGRPYTHYYSCRSWLFTCTKSWTSPWGARRAVRHCESLPSCIFYCVTSRRCIVHHCKRQHCVGGRCATDPLTASRGSRERRCCSWECNDRNRYIVWLGTVARARTDHSWPLSPLDSHEERCPTRLRASRCGH